MRSGQPAINSEDDQRFMAAALAMARRGRGRTGSNPNVGCLLVNGGIIVGRGFTQAGGRPHAEAMALSQAGNLAKGATAYVTLEPCAHISPRGPSCADSLIKAGITRCVGAIQDPDPRTAGQGYQRLRAAGITTSLINDKQIAAQAERELLGFRRRILGGLPEMTVKLAMSLDGRVAMHNGCSQWITGPVARHYAHLLRAECDLIFVGGGTLRADQPQLTNRLPGSTAPQPLRAAISSSPAPDGFLSFKDVDSLDHYAQQQGLNRLLCEGGGGLASSLLAADRVDRLILLRAPIVIGNGIGLEGFEPATLAETHEKWALEDRRQLGPDLLEVYYRR